MIPMTEGQRKEILALIRAVYTPEEAVTQMNEIRRLHPNPDQGEADLILADLRRLKRRGKPSSLPAGLYALPTAQGIERYKVERPSRGRWEGYVFVTRLRGNGSEGEPLKGAAGHRVREALERDPLSAAALYGQQTGVCGICNRTLTDDASRERGIGPVCAQKVG